MTQESAPLLGGVGLLERAISFTLGVLRAVTPQDMSRSTPCAEWDLRQLLAHMNDSFAALHEAADLGHVDLAVAADQAVSTADPVAALRSQATRLLGAWTHAGGEGSILVAESPLTDVIVSSAGAVEVAIHGWDVARACGLSLSIPPVLAEELMPLVSLFVTEADRPARFAEPWELPRSASPGDRLLGLLGRRP